MSRRLLIGTAWLVAALLLLLPLYVIVAGALSAGWEHCWRAWQEPDTRHALLLTLTVSALTVPVNLLFGLALAWLLTRFEFRGRSLLLTLLDVPFAVSPVIAGLLYLMLYGRESPLGRFFFAIHLPLVFSLAGIVLVTIFVTAPLVARELIPFMQQHGRREEEAALTLGARAGALWRRVTLPTILYPLLSGIALTNARAVGEFGAVSVLSGNIRGLTNTLALHVELLYQDYQTAAAFASALLLLLLALPPLLFKAWCRRRQHQSASR